MKKEELSQEEIIKLVNETYNIFEGNKIDGDLDSELEKKSISGVILAERAISEKRRTDYSKAFKYGLKIIDEEIGGIINNELVVISADTGVGKSDLAYNIALTNAKLGKKVYFFGLEGDITEPLKRFIFNGINKNKLKERKKNISIKDFYFNTGEIIVKEENEAIKTLKEILKNITFYNKTSIPNFKEINKIIGLASINHDIIIIDHLHYIGLDTQDEIRETSEIVKNLKLTTDTIKKPIVLISHLRKRSIAENPNVWDLHGSSNTAKNATTVLLLYNDKSNDNDLEYYLQPTVFDIVKSRIGLKGKFLINYDTRIKEYVEEGAIKIDTKKPIKKGKDYFKK